VLKSAEALALEMGNSPDVIFRHYRRAMNATAATSYFRISPADRLRAAFRVASNPDAGAIPEKILDGAGRNAPPALEIHCRQAA
jgi:hypothetical protein